MYSTAREAPVYSTAREAPVYSTGYMPAHLGGGQSDPSGVNGGEGSNGAKLIQVAAGGASGPRPNGPPGAGNWLPHAQATVGPSSLVAELIGDGPRGRDAGGVQSQGGPIPIAVGSGAAVGAPGNLVMDADGSVYYVNST